MNTRPTSPARILFLPGAAGRIDIWQPVSGLLAHPAEKRLLGWPGFGPLPRDPAVNSLDDLVQLVVSAIDRPTALVAQSMGGIVAIRAALACPHLITHLVLCVTSGGLDMQALGAQDWRPELQHNFPAFPPWFIDEHRDMSAQLGHIRAPVLLLWGDDDPLSPLAVGRRLHELLPHSELQVIHGGHHDLAFVHASSVAPLIDHHLAR